MQIRNWISFSGSSSAHSSPARHRSPTPTPSLVSASLSLRPRHRTHSRDTVLREGAGHRGAAEQPTATRAANLRAAATFDKGKPLVDWW